MQRASVFAIVVVAFLASPSDAQSPWRDSLRLILATGATCHTLPDLDSPAPSAITSATSSGASKSTKDHGGRLWYFDAWRVKGISPSCWVPAGVTVPFDRERPESGFAAVAEHALARDNASFDALVEAENFLVEPNPYAGVGQSPIATSGLLSSAA